jgi:hypothetical protein
LTSRRRSNRSCSANAGLGDRLLKDAALDAGQDALEHRAVAHRVDARELGLGELLHPVGERLRSTSPSGSITSGTPSRAR